MGLLGMIEATIEDLAITTLSLRESDAFRRRCCIEHDKNLHGSKTIPKSRYKAFWYLGIRMLTYNLYHFTFCKSLSYNYPELFMNMIFLAGFNTICIEIRDMYRFSEIGNVSHDFSLYRNNSGEPG